MDISPFLVRYLTYFKNITEEKVQQIKTSRNSTLTVLLSQPSSVSDRKLFTSPLFQNQTTFLKSSSLQKQKTAAQLSVWCLTDSNGLGQRSNAAWLACNLNSPSCNCVHKPPSGAWRGNKRTNKIQDTLIFFQISLSLEEIIISTTVTGFYSLLAYFNPFNTIPRKPQSFCSSAMSITPTRKRNAPSKHNSCT